MKVVVVIAAYNEEEVIGPLTTSLIRELDGLKDMTWELIYVIEGQDSTLDQVRKFARERSEIKVLYGERPSGLGRAFRRGFDAVPADADVVVTMDADFNHQPEEIAGLIAALEKTGADIVVGSRRVEKSAVENVPAWKSILSTTVNRVMRRIMGVDVKDMTSGFRVYRAEALQQIQFSSVGFALLPEILIKAAGKKMKVVESPIRFVFREAGESKMSFVATSLSYVRLFVHFSVPASVWLGAAIVILGIAIRLGFSYPAHEYPGDSDGILSGLCGLEVMDGTFRLFFPGGFRLSSQSCYVTAGMFSLFGVSREALAATSIFYALLFLVFFWLALREAAGGTAALVGALIAAVPPLQVILSTYPPWAYAEILACSACVLWLGLRLMDNSRERKGVEYFLFGVVLGFAFWTSPQTLMVSGPILCMLVFRRAIPLRVVPFVIVGIAICLYPYFLLIAYRGPGPLHSFATQPVTSIRQLQSNFSFLLHSVIPTLLFTQEWNHLSLTTLNGIRALVVIASSAITIPSVFALKCSNTNGAAQLRRALLLALLILFCSVLLFAVSGAGSVRGWTVRYMLPLFLVLPLHFAICFATFARRGRVGIAVVVFFLAIAHSAEYPFLHQAERASSASNWIRNRTTILWLTTRQRQIAIGDFWTVYHLNFDTARSVRGIPIEPMEDYFGFGKSLQNPARAALLDGDRSHLESWVRLVGLRGRIEQLSDGLYAYAIDT